MPTPYILFKYYLLDTGDQTQGLDSMLSTQSTTGTPSASLNPIVFFFLLKCHIEMIGTESVSFN